MEPIVNPTDEAGASLFLEAATQAVRIACGWHVSPVAEISGTLSAGGGRILRLPCMNVAELSELRHRDGADLLPLCSWSPGGLVELDAPIAPGVAAVSYRCTAGFEPSEVPVLQAVILQAAKRAMAAPGGFVRSQSVNGASVTYATGSSGAPAVSLTPEELSLISAYRVGRLP